MKDLFATFAWPLSFGDPYYTVHTAILYKSFTFIGFMLYRVMNLVLTRSTSVLLFQAQLITLVPLSFTIYCTLCFV